MNDTPFKVQAQRLADYLSRVHGVKLKHASMLEAIAQVHGRADWNTLRACGSADFPPTTIGTTPAGTASAVAPTHVGQQVPLLTHLLEHVPRELAALGLSSVAEWRRALSHQSGVLVVGGTTGTGKTTTAVATARELARQDRRIFILDHDIREGDVPGAIHGPASREQGTVVVVDLRSTEDVRSAFDLAQKGAMVIASLHTTSLLHALGRITDAGVSQEEQERLLRALVVQRLLPRACKACEGAGCDACIGGVAGRRLVAECVSARAGATISERLFGEGCDVVPMAEDAVEYCRLGAISPAHLVQHFGDDVRRRLAARNR